MISFRRLLDVIAKTFPSLTKPFDREAEKAIRQLDPDKIYVENIREILGTNEASARDACEAAVRQGVLKRYVEVLCPDGTQAAVAESREELPDVVSCEKVDGSSVREVHLKTENLRTIPFYRINDRQPVRS